MCFVFEQSLSVLCSGLNYHEDHLLQKKFHSNLLDDTALKSNALPGQFDILGETKKCDLFLLGHLSFLKQDFICSISNFTIFEAH